MTGRGGCDTHFDHLPAEQGEVDGVESDVGGTGRLVALLHGRDKGGSKGPEDSDSCPCKQVGAGEELPDTQVGVEAALYRQEDAHPEEKRSHVVVLVLEVPSGERFALLWTEAGRAGCEEKSPPDHPWPRRACQSRCPPSPPSSFFSAKKIPLPSLVPLLVVLMSLFSLVFAFS